MLMNLPEEDKKNLMFQNFYELITGYIDCYNPKNEEKIYFLIILSSNLLDHNVELLNKFTDLLYRCYNKEELKNI